MAGSSPEQPKRPRRVVVTGATEGIGRGIAEVLAEAGHMVGLTARSQEALDARISELAHRGRRACAAAGDVRDAVQTRAVMRALGSALGGLDAVVVNAGIVSRASILEITDAEWRDLVDTNLHGAFNTIRAALPFFVEKTTAAQPAGGHIIVVSSISWRLPLAPGSGYAATKYAVTGLAESLFLELRELDVKVTTVYPGSVATPSHREPGSDDSWKVTPREVGEACRSVLETRRENVISRLEIRPLRKPR